MTMLKDIALVQNAPITQMKLTHFVGLMTYTKDCFNHEFDEENPAPAKIVTQLASFTTAYTRLDNAYKTDSYSLLTKDLKEADDACDKIFMSSKKMTQAQQQFDFDQQKKASADRIMQCIDKFKIDTAEDYLGQNNKMQQLLQEINQSALLTADAAALGLTDAFAQLAEKVALVRQLLTQRGLARTPKGEMQAARSAMEPEYRWLISILNAYALVDEDEQRFLSLVNRLNMNIDYLKNVVLPRQGYEEEDGGGDDPTPTPTPEPTPDPEPTPTPDPEPEPGGDGGEPDES